jgi:hypothetical protein
MPFEELKARQRVVWRGRLRAHRRDPPGAGRSGNARFRSGIRGVCLMSRWRGLAASWPRRCPLTAEEHSRQRSHAAASGSRLQGGEV